jgi:hypothetical protein
VAALAAAAAIFRPGFVAAGRGWMAAARFAQCEMEIFVNCENELSICMKYTSSHLACPVRLRVSKPGQDFA